MDSLLPRRLFAHLTDGLVLFSLVALPLSFFLNLPEQGIFSIAVSVYAALAGVLYWTLSDFFIGQSIGKAVFSLRTISRTRERAPNILQSLARNLSKFAPPFILIDSLPLLFGKGQGNLRYSERLLARTSVVDWGNK